MVERGGCTNDAGLRRLTASLRLREACGETKPSESMDANQFDPGSIIMKGCKHTNCTHWYKVRVQVVESERT